MPTLAELAAAKKIRPRDLDIVYVAYGEISRESIAKYLTGGDGDRRPATEVARELTDRICTCQHHDGGRTSLVEAREAAITFQVEGACVTCPQIRYTMGLLESSAKLRSETPVEVRFLGVARDRPAAPPDHQLTLALLMRRTGMTFADLDNEIDRRGRLLDEDLERLAQRCLIRQSLTPADDGANADGDPGASHRGRHREGP